MGDRSAQPGDLGVLADEQQELLDVDEDGAAGEAAEQEDEGGSLQDHPHAQQVPAAVGLQGERAVVRWQRAGGGGQGRSCPGHAGKGLVFQGEPRAPCELIAAWGQASSACKRSRGSVQCLGSIRRCWKTPCLQDKCQHLLPTCDIKVSHAEDKP